MNDIRIFTHDTFGQIRITDNNGDPWFVAKDVCRSLDLANPRTSVALLEEDEKGVLTMDTLGGPQEVSIISEAGLYSLILRSRKPEAKAFRRWVTHDVLPAVRKHGGYLTPEKVEDILSDPDTLIRLATDLKAERARRRELEAQSAIDAPKAAVYDAVVADKTLTLRDFCRRLEGVNLNKVKECLHMRGILYRGAHHIYRVYAKYRDTHLAETFDSGCGKLVLRVLPDGQKLLTRLYRSGKLEMKAGFAKPNSGKKNV